MAAIAWHFWPGVAMYDTLEQYSQVLTGKVDDWHPPAMVRLWQLLRPLGPGASPMFVLQVGLYAAGFSLIIAALARCNRPFSGLAVLILAISPLLLGWQMVVLKDAQMLGALIGAFAIILGYRLSARRIPPPLALTAGLLLAYATLVRANAAFATVPLIVLIFPRPRSLILRGGLALAIIGVVLALTPLADRSLLAASNSGVAKSLPLFDLAAIAVAVPDAPGPFTRAERDQISKLHCVKDYFWDPLGDPTACGPITERVRAEPETQLYAELAHALIAHPLAYAAHRIRHWNSTERWLVASGLPDIAPPDETEPNDLGLRTPSGGFAEAWQDAAAIEAASPIAWPIIWTSLCLLLFPLAVKRRDDPAGGLALALLGSAVTLEGSFLFISIASDMRYHLWSITASALALVLLGNDLRTRRRLQVAICATLLFLIIPGLLARASLPVAPDTYLGMIHAASG